MEISIALNEIDDLLNSEVYKDQNLKLYLKKKNSENGSIYQEEFELIEKMVKLFLKSLSIKEIRSLWNQLESREIMQDSERYEVEINSATNELESELLDMYIKGL